MVSSVVGALAVAFTFAVYTVISGLRENIAKARKTGLPYIVVPIHPFNILWQLTCDTIWLPIIKLFPKSWWDNWLFIMLPNWEYTTRQEHFQRLGSESFLVVSPGDMTLFTNNAEAIHQMSLKREAFPKDTSRYGVLSMFGDNVLTTEGAIWRLHRKVTSASFNEKNAAHTFAEAIRQTRGLISMYFGSKSAGEQAESTKTITSLEHDTMDWALNIIGYVGFGLRLIWPGQELPGDMDPKLAKYGSLQPPEGYTMTFRESLAMVLERILVLLVVPWPLLRILPFEYTRKAREAKVNYIKYMEEFLHDKAEEAQKGVPETEGMDIMRQLVRSTYGPQAETKESSAAAGTGTGTGGGMKLTDSEIIGNAFIMTVAGHETTANILHFALLELASNPTAQRRLQRDIDGLFGDTDPTSWGDADSYDKNVSAMLASHIGACVNETLRMVPPVTQIPKIVSFDSDQALVVDGRRHVIPPRVSVVWVATAAQRNPRYWPTKPSERTDAPTDLDDFVPERWYRTNNSNGADATQATEEEASTEDYYGGYQGSNTSAALFRPVRGSFMPFSDGARSCLGRRIAMVELVAALAVIFQHCSIELAVDEWASDEEVDRMSPEQRREVYRKAQRKSREVIDGAVSLLTLKLASGKNVPVRLVKRGNERFVADEGLA